VTKKPLIRRVVADHSQRIRSVVQWSFLALNAWIGIQFLLWVRHYESAGSSVRVDRPAGVEGWLPIAALMNLKYWIQTGEVPQIHAAGMFLLLAFLMMSFLLRKAFCSWLCPIGTISEWLWKFGRDTFRRNWILPRWADIPLRSLKYVLLALFLYAVGSMGPEAIAAFLSSPYGLVADVKMLNFFRFLTIGGAVTIGFLLLFSVFIQNFWCRFLCPYGALMGIAALLSPVRIRRNEATCIDCAKCAKACPAVLPVDKLVQIRSAECAACMACVAVCPADQTLMLGLTRKRGLPPLAVAAALAAIFFGIVGYAQYMGYWDTYLPERVYLELIPRAREFSHP
jgi:polyferredoxin